MGGEEYYSAPVIVTFDLPTGTRVTCDEKTAAALGGKPEAEQPGPEPEAEPETAPEAEQPSNGKKK